MGWHISASKLIKHYDCNFIHSFHVYLCTLAQIIDHSAHCQVITILHFLIGNKIDFFGVLLRYVLTDTAGVLGN